MNNLRKFQQLLEGISQQDLADTLCARLETRYPDIYNKYDYDTVYRAVDDVSSFHSGAEELGTSDIGMMLRSVIKRLEEYQGVAEDSLNESDKFTSWYDWKDQAKSSGYTVAKKDGKIVALNKQGQVVGHWSDVGKFLSGKAPRPNFKPNFKRPVEQDVAEGLSSDKNMSALQKVVDTAAKYGFKMSNRSKNGQKIILHNTDFHQWMTCRIRNINGKIYIDYDESSNINGLRNEVVTPSEFIQRLKNYYLKGQAWLEKIRKRDAAEKNFVGIRVEQYPYGKPSSGLRAAVKFLNRNGKRGHEYFDFPEYADIPDEISNQLMPEEVDFIQDRWDEVPVGKQGVAEGWKQNLAVAGAIAGTYGGITALHNATPHASVNGVGHYYATFSPPRHAIKTVDDKGNPVYTWKTRTKHGTMNLYRPVDKVGTMQLYRPADKVDQIKEQGVAEEQLDELKCWDGYKRVPGTKSGAPGSCEKINELSTEKLAQYKKAAGADARKADKEGDFERGNKRFSGIVKATKKQFDNETKPKKESAIMKGIVDETLGTPYPGTYEQENKPFMRKGAKRTMKLTTEGNKNVGR